MNNKLISIIALALLVMVGSHARAGLIFNNTNDQLLGADNVLVNGMLYDVRFMDGTCVSLYTGCDDVSDFLFQTPVTATAALQALTDMFAATNYTPTPGVFSGCEDSKSDVCNIVNPYKRNSGNQASAERLVYRPGFRNVVFSTMFDVEDDSTIAGRTNFAVWKTAVKVNSPSTVAIFALGLLGLASRRFKKQS